MRQLILFLLPLIFSCGQKKAKDITVGGVKTKPIPGLTASAIHDNFTKKGFKLEKTTDGELSVWTSTENNEAHEFKVSTSSTNPNNLISVQASVVSMLTLDQSARDFIGDVASLQYKYEISLAEVARIWKGGCIIRSLMLNDIRKSYLKNDLLKNLLLDKDFYTLVIQHRTATTDILKIAMDNRTAVPCMGSALNYVDMFGTGRSGSNLIQAQRDYFGAHTYERIDKPGESFHTNWN